MRISKSLLFTLGAALVCTISAAQGADTDAQRKAREALRQKLAETEGAVTAPRQGGMNAQGTTTAATTREAAVAPATSGTPMERPSGPSDPQSIAKAREALRVKMAELGSGTGAGDQMSPPASADDAAIAKARESLRQKMQQLGPETTDSGTTARAAEAQARAAREARRSTGMAPLNDTPVLQAPPSTLTTDQQQKLAELLRKYRADELSPQEYHAERAKVLSQK